MLVAEYRMMRAIMRSKHTSILPRSYYSSSRMPATEREMHLDCIDFMKRLGWELIDYEWQAVRMMERCGRGDMVFQRGCIYLVMEAKRRRNKKVKDQAQYYGSVWKLQRAQDRTVVAYGIWTTSSQEIMGVVATKRAAADICWPRFLYHSSGDI